MPSDPRSVDTSSLSHQTDRFPEYQQTLVIKLPVLYVSLAKDVAITLAVTEAPRLYTKQIRAIMCTKSMSVKSQAPVRNSFLITLVK